jgi:hypothetical protein
MRGYVQATSEPARPAWAEAADNRTGLRAGAAAVPAGASLDTRSPADGAKAGSLRQMRRALDRGRPVQSQLALQRALNERAASPEAPAQKRRGKPTLQMKGVAISADGLRPVARSPRGEAEILQRKVETAGGFFDKTEYSAERDGASVGANMAMTFIPKLAAPDAKDEKDHKDGKDQKAAEPSAKTIGMIQTNRRTVMIHAHNAGKPERKAVMTETEAARSFNRTHIDRRDFDEETGTMRQNNPVYQSAENTPETKRAQAWVAQSIKDIPKAPADYGQLWTVAKPNDPAILIDKPRYNAADRMKKVVDEFETAAVVLEGQAQNTYLGSVKWGWESEGFTVKLRSFELGKQGNPSRRFLAAAKKWNEQELPTDKAGKKMPTIKVPIPGN